LYIVMWLIAAPTNIAYTPGRVFVFHSARLSGFTREEQGYRVVPELRAVVVFTAQDVLADPPFSRLDLISCRNLLIYLRSEAQQKVFLLFHFALSERGILMLGGAETVGSLDDRFEPISKTQQIYRQIGRSRSGEIDFPIGSGGAARTIWPGGPHPAAARGISASDLTSRLLIETYAPASVLINRKYECLYYSGPTDRYLQVAAGEPSRDLLAMAREGLRYKLRAAVQQASRERAHTTATGAQASYGGVAVAVRIEVHPVQRDGEELLLVSFFDEPVREPRADRPVEPMDDVPRSPSSSGNSTLPARSWRAPSTTSRSPTRSRRRSTKKPCRRTRSSSRRTKS
jgi:two-component system CheB/CheR fusion protein